MKNEQDTILVVDDDHDIRNLLGDFLKQHGFSILLAKDGDEMQSMMSRYSPDLIVLDVMMPGKDGLSLCRELRATSNIPIIMLTAAGEAVDRIVGLEMGADDYLCKPFNPRELLARVKAILRRAQNIGSEKGQQEQGSFEFVGWTLDRGARRLLSPDMLEVSLSTGEFTLLVALLERPQQVLSRDQLLDLTKNRMASPFDRSIDIQISRLRNKIEEDPKQPQIIKTIRGGGYMLAVPVEVGTNEKTI